MDLAEAMSRRHMVRRYQDVRLPAEIAEKLSERVEENNRTHGLSIKLMLNDGNALGAAENSSWQGESKTI